MTDPLEIPPPTPSTPASPAEGPSPESSTRTLGYSSNPAAPAYRPSADDPDLLAAANGTKTVEGRKTKRAINRTSFQPGTPFHRPPMMSKEVVLQVLTGIRTKATAEGAAAFAGISPSTFKRWRREDRDFAELVDVARAVRLEELIDLKLEYAKSGKKGGSDWRAIAHLIDRLPWAHRHLFKRDPNAVTPEVLASKIGEIVTRILPLVEADKQGYAQTIMEEICASLAPLDDGGDGDGS